MEGFALEPGRGDATAALMNIGGAAGDAGATLLPPPVALDACAVII